ncbi:unnamed protein product [Staurois parvus]|uniref:Uncharacterized protein n=1 Tax=Staurois parvus TaxID=386267 RepID=A0ABN9E0G7_9NEOB|nr:unnamed protein product [Staurois parvus]
MQPIRSDTGPAPRTAGIVGLLYNLPFCGAGPVSPRVVGVTWCCPHPPHLHQDATG